MVELGNETPEQKKDRLEKAQKQKIIDHKKKRDKEAADKKKKGAGDGKDKDKGKGKAGEHVSPPPAGKKKAAKKKAVEVKTERRDLKCKLTGQQVKEYGQELASKERTKENLENEKKDSANFYKEKVDAINTEIKKLARKVDSESEYREIVCEWKYDSKIKMMCLVRTDTGEEIDRRERTPSEKQTELL